jgi:hypothetical protein
MKGLEGLEDIDILPLRLQGVGFEFLMGQLEGIQTVIPAVDLVAMSVDQVVGRDDYTLEGDTPGNRIISTAHVKKIKEGLRKHATKLVLGTFILAVDPDGVTLETLSETTGEGNARIRIVRYGIRSGRKLFILDAQHRNRALQELWDETIEAVRSGDIAAGEVAQLLRQSSVPVLIILENDRDQISRMFVTLASTKPISPSLIAVMDRESLANRFGLAVAKNTKLLGQSERLAYQTSTATGDDLYAAAAVRGAAASLFIGFRDRSPEMREDNLSKECAKLMEEHGLSEEAAFDAMVGETVNLFDYAYTHIPGWKELSDERSDFDAKTFRSEYVHGSAAGFYVIAGVLGAARHAPGVDPKHVIDLLASKIEWRKNELVKAPDAELYSHPSFEDTLVVTEPELDEDGQIVDWKTRTGGGNRTAYEKATRNVLETLVKADSSVSELMSPAVLGEIGLAPRVDGTRRGRPPKAPAVTL